MRALSHIFYEFLKLGALGFGGPFALIATMRSEFVERQRWIQREEFDRVFPIIKAMPGAVAFQTAAYLGYRKAGWWGAVASSIGLILPAFLLMILFAKYHELAEQVHWLRSLLNGLQLSAIALMAGTLISLIKPHRSDLLFFVLVLISFFLFKFTPIPEFILLVLGGGFGILKEKNFFKPNQNKFNSFLLFQLFWVCFSAGAFVFGSGMAIAPMLERDVVAQYSWMSHSEFLDAFALGQITPGPILIFVAFIGFKLAGFLGASLATLAVFLPGFFHMTTWFPRAFNYLSKKSWIFAFSWGALAVVVGTLLQIVSSQVMQISHSVAAMAILIGLVVLILRFSLSSLVIILLGGACGLLQGFFLT